MRIDSRIGGLPRRGSYTGPVGERQVAASAPDLTCLTCSRTVPSTTEHAPGEEWRTAQHPVKAYREVPAGSVAARIMRHRS